VDQEGGEVGAIVVAESEDICDEALRTLDVKWETAHVVDILEGRMPAAPVIRSPSQGPSGGGSMGAAITTSKRRVSYSM
jgi:CO/xanthine dehydrogenase Mo-binding subunit